MELRKEIAQTLDEITNLQTIKRHFEDIIEQIEEVNAQIESLDIQVQKELEDVVSLENTSVRKIFHKVLGSHEKKIEKEREEYLETVLSHKEALKSLELLEYEKGIIEKKVIRIEPLKQRLEELKTLRFEEIMATHSNERESLIQIESQVDAIHVYAKELEEVNTVNNALIKNLRAVIQYLESSEYYLSRDSYYSRQHLKGNLNEAFKGISQARVLLHRLNKELADINYRNVDFNLQIDFGKLTPFFIRNFISDMTTRYNISSALNLLQTNLRTLQALHVHLDSEYKKKLQERVDLMSLRDGILEG